MPDTVDAAPPVDAPKMTHAEKIKAGREKAAAARAAAAAAPVALPPPAPVASPAAVAIAPEMPHPVVAASMLEARPLMDPVQFLMVFFSTNPGLIQALEAYPNKTTAAEGLYINAYKAYVEIAAPGRNADLWAMYNGTRSALTGK